VGRREIKLNSTILELTWHISLPDWIVQNQATHRGLLQDEIQTPNLPAYIFRFVIDANGWSMPTVMSQANITAGSTLTILVYPAIARVAGLH